MYESDTFMAILEEGEAKGLEKGLKKGRIEEARKTIKLFGEQRFGPADETVAQQLDAIDDLAQLEAMITRFMQANSWAEWLNQSPG